MSDKDLTTLHKLFNERIYRIPDYQRGYAWTQKELSDFWEDLVNLVENQNGNGEEKRSHYTGMITLEKIPESEYKTWTDDAWLLKQQYTPFYVVDGQQRLTTCII